MAPTNADAVIASGTHDIPDEENRTVYTCPGCRTNNFTTRQSCKHCMLAHGSQPYIPKTAAQGGFNPGPEGEKWTLDGQKGDPGPIEGVKKYEEEKKAEGEPQVEGENRDEEKQGK